MQKSGKEGDSQRAFPRLHSSIRMAMQEIQKVRVAQPYPLPVFLGLAEMGEYIQMYSRLFCYTLFGVPSWDWTPAEVNVLQHSDGLSG
ncbi:UNVERIFIED_CONTAM: hypothetical protein H355_006595 [Colinus virginianus]|nr:hypothetical protein H355_006595 [Colinus virginianus]